MKSVQVWINEIDSNHQSRMNRLIHMISIPLVSIGLYGTGWKLSHEIFSQNQALNLTVWTLALIGLYHLIQNLRTGPILIVFFSSMILFFNGLNQFGNLAYWFTMLSILIISVLSLRYGHQLEGRKHSKGGLFQSLNTSIWVVNLYKNSLLRPSEYTSF